MIGATPLDDHFTTSQVVFDKHGLNTKGQAACNLFVTISRVLEKLLQLVPVRFSPTNHHRFKNIPNLCQKNRPFHENLVYNMDSGIKPRRKERRNERILRGRNPQAHYVLATYR
jgi:hypothetical protein